MRVVLATALLFGLCATAQAEEADTTAASTPIRPHPRVAAPT